MRMHVTAAPGMEVIQQLTCHHQTPQLPASTLGALALQGAVQRAFDPAWCSAAYLKHPPRQNQCSPDRGSPCLQHFAS